MKESDSRESFSPRLRYRAVGVLRFYHGIADPENMLARLGAADEFLDGFHFGNDCGAERDGLAVRPFRSDSR